MHDACETFAFESLHDNRSNHGEGVEFHQSSRTPFRRKAPHCGGTNASPPIAHLGALPIGASKRLTIAQQETTGLLEIRKMGQLLGAGCWRPARPTPLANSPQDTS